MKPRTLSFVTMLLACSAALAQEQPPAPGAFEEATSEAQQRLEQSLAELSALLETHAAERIPLNERVSSLESERRAVQDEYQQTTRLLDSRTLDLSNLRTDIEARKDAVTYVSGLLNDYLRNFESGVHIAELQRHRESLQAAKLAAENINLAQEEVFAAQLAFVMQSIDRLFDAAGGTRFEGTAVEPGGLVKQGTFALVGAAALFRSADGQVVGTAEQRIGSLEPTVIPFQDPESARAAAALVSSGSGEFPFDPTLGNAHKVEATQETWLEHVQKGGTVMVPIFVLAAAALLAALYKWLSLAFVRNPSPARVEALLGAVAEGDAAQAKRVAAEIRGPTGRMLEAGVEHLGEPHELIEEVMFEKVLATRLKLQRLLPFIGISAAAAPLLGLLGTVTGIINTFKLITVFGTGDVKTLSGGISEALITTEYGLIVAIPSLLLHALLSRKARGVTDRMEKAAVALVNQVAKIEARQRDAGKGSAHSRTDNGGTRAPSADQVREALAGLLLPAIAANLEGKTGHAPAG